MCTCFGSCDNLLFSVLLFTDIRIISTKRENSLSLQRLHIKHMIKTSQEKILKLKHFLKSLIKSKCINLCCLRTFKLPSLYCGDCKDTYCVKNNCDGTQVSG